MKLRGVELLNRLDDLLFEIIIGFGLLGFLLSRVAGYVSPSSAERQGAEDTEEDPG